MLETLLQIVHEVNRARDLDEVLSITVHEVKRAIADADVVSVYLTDFDHQQNVLMLAEGLQKQPSHIIMDEPTNHMDLPSIQCVEQALVDCGCATLLVSHDFSFLQNVVSYFWIVKRDGKNSRIVPGFDPDI